MAIVSVTKDMVEQALRETDWSGLDGQTDEDIARNVAFDPDTAPILTEAENIGAFAKSIRQRMGLSQQEFAKRFRIPLGTLRDWEQGRAQPDGPAIAYLRVIAARGDMVAAVLAD